MKLGTLGIFSKEIFDTSSPKYINKSYVYLTLASDRTEEYKEKYPKIRRTVFEARWVIIEQNTDLICAAMFLSESIVPCEIVSTGTDFKVSSTQDNKWRYYKVLLSMNGRVETVYVHEKCMNYFNWFHKEDIGSHEGDLLSLLPSQ